MAQPSSSPDLQPADSAPATQPSGAPSLAADFPGEQGRLFIVATPIGNRDDLSPRARRILEGCDLVLAEDTRRLFALLRDLGLHVARAMSFHDHNEQEKEPEILNLLRHNLLMLKRKIMVHIR